MAVKTNAAGRYPLPAIAILLAALVVPGALRSMSAASAPYRQWETPAPAAYLPVIARPDGPTATPATPTPTSLPGPPELLQPADGALLPQPVAPNQWFFAWSARTGPCYADIEINGPGGRAMGSSAVDWRISG